MILILGHCHSTNPTEMIAICIFLFCTMLMAAAHLRSVSQNFTGSGFLIPSMLRIAKNYSSSCSFHVFPPTVKQSGLMLLLLTCGDVAINPGPVMLGLVNARSIRNKGPLLSDTIASHAFYFLCLTETHIRTTDSDSFLRSLTPDGFSLIHRPCSTGIGGGVGFFIRESYKYRKVDTPNYSSFENIVISISVLGRTFLSASIYRPPGPCSSIFLDELMSFVFCLLLITIISSAVISIYMLMYLVLIVTNWNPC